MQPDAPTRLLNSVEGALKAEFAGIVGAENVSDNEAALWLHSEDMWETSDRVAALVIAPQSLEKFSRTVAAA